MFLSMPLPADLPAKTANALTTPYGTLNTTLCHYLKCMRKIETITETPHNILDTVDAVLNQLPRPCLGVPERLACFELCAERCTRACCSR